MPVYGGVRYVDLYPGVDLVLGEQGDFWRLEAQPQVNTSDVHLRIQGLDEVLPGPSSSTLLTAMGDCKLALPVADFVYLAEGIIANGARSIAQIEPHSLEPGANARSGASPQNNPDHLMYSTFLGGSDGDFAGSITYDTLGRAYVGGASDDIYPDLWITPQGRAYVSGYTFSVDFPTTPGVLDPSCGENVDGFVLALTPDGSALELSTCLGGTINDAAYAVAVDAAGSIFVAGHTGSPDSLVTAGAFHWHARGGFVAKLDATATPTPTLVHRYLPLILWN